MGESKKDRGQAIEEALESAERDERLEDDRDWEEEARRAEAALEKARNKKDMPSD